MAFDSKKTILLEKTYLYVRASLGFQLEGTSTEKIPTNNGFYRFFVDNLQKAIGNSYVNILYDSQDLTLQCFCSDLYMDELMSSDSSAIEDVVEELKKNTSTILEFESGVSSALDSNHQDNVVLNTSLMGISDKLFKWSTLGPFLSFDYLYNNNQYVSHILKFDDFVRSPLVNSSHNIFSDRYQCVKNFLLFGIEDVSFDVSLDLPAYISSFNDFFSDKNFSYLLNPLLFSFGSKGTVSDLSLLPSGSTVSQSYARLHCSRINSGSLIKISLNATINDYIYNLLCLCSHELNNFFYKESSDVSHVDSIYLTRGLNMPCCSLNQKLNIYKVFDSEKNYEFTATFDFPFDEATFKKFHFYFIVNNEFVEVVPSFVNKGNHHLLNCNFVFSGSSSYYIESMSVFPF